MIVHWILQLLSTFLHYVVVVLDAITPDVPDIVGTVSAKVDTLSTYLGQTSVWIPWGIVGPMLGIVGTAFVAAFGIRVVRIVQSSLTGGGGA